MCASSESLNLPSLKEIRKELEEEEKKLKKAEELETEKEPFNFTDRKEVEYLDFPGKIEEVEERAGPSVQRDEVKIGFYTSWIIPAFNFILSIICFAVGSLEPEQFENSLVPIFLTFSGLVLIVDFAMMGIQSIHRHLTDQRENSKLEKISYIVRWIVLSCYLILIVFGVLIIDDASPYISINEDNAASSITFFTAFYFILLRSFIEVLGLLVILLLKYENRNLTQPETSIYQVDNNNFEETRREYRQEEPTSEVDSPLSHDGDISTSRSISSVGKQKLHMSHFPDILKTKGQFEIAENHSDEYSDDFDPESDESEVMTKSRLSSGKGKSFSFSQISSIVDKQQDENGENKEKRESAGSTHHEE